jgi:hypothetical protein
MKTPMQFLKEEIESKVFPKEYNNGNLTDYQYGHNIAYSVVLTLIEHLIEVEKRQIIEAYIAERYVLAGGHPIRIDQAEDYYNRTYNQ